MFGLSQYDHDGGNLSEGEEVLRLLLVARRHPSVLLDLRPEPLHDSACPVQVPVYLALLDAVLTRWDHRHRATRTDLLHQRVAVVTLVRDHHLRFVVRQETLGLLLVRFLSRACRQLDRMAQRVDARVDLGSESAPRAAKSLLPLASGAVPLFLAPAAVGWARTAVESRISHSMSSSRRASMMAFQRPFLAQRSNRRHTLLCLPKRAGRSSQGTPVRATYSTASMNRRLSWAMPPCCPGRPGNRCSMRSQSASEIACRGNMAALRGE